MHFLITKILQRKTAPAKSAAEVGQRFLVSLSTATVYPTAWQENVVPAHLLRVKAAPEDAPGDVVLSFFELKPISHIYGGCERAI